MRQSLVKEYNRVKDLKYNVKQIYEGKSKLPDMNTVISNNNINIEHSIKLLNMAVQILVYLAWAWGARTYL